MNNMLFTSLPQREQNIVIDAMVQRRFEPGEPIIVQGDPGDEFFILAQGEADCFVTSGGETKCVLHYVPGMSFGELALMYNAPRAASVTATIPCTCWC